MVKTYKGIDISEHQNGLRLKKLQDIDFVILRAGYTGWGTGVDYNKDKCFEEWYEEAKAIGLPVGAYWYSCANSKEKGENEAKFMYQNCLKGKKFEYPIYIDVEEPRHQTGKKRGVTDAVIGFCEYLESKGFYVGIYASDVSGFKDKMILSDLVAYDKWVARWDGLPKYVTSYGMHQTTSMGYVNGYSSRLDLDTAYKNYPEIMRQAGLNGYKKETQEPDKTEEPSEPIEANKLQVGDKVEIVGMGRASAGGNLPETNLAIGYMRYVTAHHKGAAYPYQVGNKGKTDSNNTTGFFKASALKKV